MADGIKILIVDDDADICDTLKDVLEMKNYKVTIALSGHEALEKTGSDTFEAILMDLEMPGLDGPTTLARIKARSPETPIIIFSAYSSGDLVDRAYAGGAVAAVQKPLIFEKLFSTIDTVRAGVS